MNNLEKYIQDNLEQFNTGELPQGHQKRFMAKLAQEQKPGRIRPFTRRAIFASTAAAAVIIALTITGIPAYKEAQLERSVQEIAQEMYRQEAEILQMFSQEEQYMINNVKAITEEAIPLAEQLPNELSSEKRAQILRNYYKAKTAALKQIKILYAQSEQPID